MKKKTGPKKSAGKSAAAATAAGTKETEEKNMRKGGEKAAEEKKEEIAFRIGPLEFGKQWLLICAGICIVFFAAVGYISLTTDFNPGFTFAVNEEKLVKNADLSLLPGENYSYIYWGNETVTYKMEYEVLGNQGPGQECTAVRTLVNNQTDEMICLNAQGNEVLNGKVVGTNLSYQNKSLYFFRPWMLALAPGWEWGANTSVLVGSPSLQMEAFNVTNRVQFAVVAEEELFGRPAYKVAVLVIAPSTGESKTIWEWVDKEKRVLLLELADGEEVRIWSAPFPLVNNTKMYPAPQLPACSQNSS